MKSFDKHSFLELRKNYRIQAKLVQLSEPTGFVVEPYKPIDKYFFTFDIIAPEFVTAIGIDNKIAFKQTWELVNNKNTNGKVELFFKIWADPPTPLNGFQDSLKYQHNFFSMPLEVFMELFNILINSNPSLYSIEKLKKTQGLEGVI